MVWIPNNHLPWKSQTKPTPDSDLCGYQADLISFVVGSVLSCPRLSSTRQFWKAWSRLGLVQSLPLAAQRSHWRSALNWPSGRTKIFKQFGRNSSRIGIMLTEGKYKTTWALLSERWQWHMQRNCNNMLQKCGKTTLAPCRICGPCHPAHWGIHRSVWLTPYSSKCSSSRDSSSTRKTCAFRATWHRGMFQDMCVYFFWDNIDLDFKTALQLLRGASPSGQLWGRRKRKLCSCLRIPQKTQQGSEWSYTRVHRIGHICSVSLVSSLSIAICLVPGKASPVARYQGSAAPKTL